MNKPNPIYKVGIIILQIILFLIFGYFFYNYLLQTEKITTFYDFFVFIFYISMLAITFTWVIYEVVRDYKKTKNLLGLISIFAGTVVCIFLYSTYYQIKNLDSSPVYLSASYTARDWKANFYLKEDSTYLLTLNDMFGTNYFRGNYTLQDSLILLDKDTVSYVIKSKKLLIQKDSTEEGFIINQVDENMNSIEDNHPFVVLENVKEK